MKNASYSPALRFLPSFTDLAFLMPIVFFLKRGGGPSMLEGDTGWHIRAGEWILANGRVPDTDFFSFTRSGQPWFAWEWLWDVAFAWLHQRAGMEAVVLVSLLLICLTFALVFRSSRRASGNVLLAAVFTVAATISSSIHWLARPHLFTLLFTALFCLILDRVHEGRTKLLWLLPAITIPWVNLHGGFLVGIIIVLTCAAGELTSWLVESGAAARAAALRRACLFAATAAGCAAASLVNPYTYHLHIHIVRYLRDPYLWDNIQEFLPLSFRHPGAWFFEPLIVLGLMAAFWSLYRRRFTDAWLVLGWTHAALFGIRNLPILMIVATPIISRAAAEWVALPKPANLSSLVRGFLDWLSEAARETGYIDAAWRTHLVSAAAFVSLAALFFFGPPAPQLRANYDPSKYPAAAVQTLSSDAAGRKIFADDEWGDYLIYRLYPAGRVFVDGRSDFYQKEFCEKYLEVMRLKRDWEGTLGRYGVDTLLLPADAPITAAVEKSPAWRCAYRDKVAAVFHAVPASAAGMAPSGLTLGKHSANHRGREVAQLQHRDRMATQLTQ